VNTTSSPYTLQLTNSGSATLQITSLAITGTNTKDFSQTDTCKSSLPAGKSCTITVRFEPKAVGPQTAYVMIRDNVARWADEFALELRGLAVEEWLRSLGKNEGGELEGPTLGKIKQVMMVILRHAEKYGRLPTGFTTELGKQISISTSSVYEAVILTPEQTMTILSLMRQTERTLTLLVAATGLRWSEITGLQWQDVDWSGNRSHLRRTFIDGNIAEHLKTRRSNSAVAMAPLLARFPREWQGATK
jgi:hypothetical protein